MSAIGILHIVPTAVLAQVETAASDEIQSALEKATISTIVYQYDGWLLSTLLPVLATDYGINLMNSHHELAGKLSRSFGNSQFIFTETEKEACLSGLDPVSFSVEKLQQDYEAFSQTVADGAGEVMLDGIAFLRAGLQQITTETVAILSIG